jgi:hypothetical protein
MVMQRKTQRPVQFEITATTREAVDAWIHHAGLKSEDYLFPSRLHVSPHISTRQYARILHRWSVISGWIPPHLERTLCGAAKRP